MAPPTGPPRCGLSYSPSMPPVASGCRKYPCAACGAQAEGTGRQLWSTFCGTSAPSRSSPTAPSSRPTCRGAALRAGGRARLAGGAADRQVPGARPCPCSNPRAWGRTAMSAARRAARLREIKAPVRAGPAPFRCRWQRPRTDPPLVRRQWLRGESESVSLVDRISGLRFV